MSLGRERTAETTASIRTDPIPTSENFGLTTKLGSTLKISKYASRVLSSAPGAKSTGLSNPTVKSYSCIQNQIATETQAKFGIGLLVKLNLTLTLAITLYPNTTDPTNPNRNVVLTTRIRLHQTHHAFS